MFLRIFANEIKLHNTMNYPTNLTDNQWLQIEKYFPNGSRKRKHALRDVVNAILYLLKTGCQWRMMPNDLPSWNSVYYYFSQWKRDGTFELIL